MSMLPSQVDELRELATRYDELQVGAVKAVTMPSNMGSILREAADTIWQLRDDLQRANAENDKLRESVRRLMTQRDERLARAEADNAKLRALCRDMYLVVELLDMDGARLQAHGRDADWRTLKERYNELGVDA